jgi:hypothetical protein
MQWKDSAPGTGKNIASGSVTGATTAVVPVAVIDRQRLLGGGLNGAFFHFKPLFLRRIIIATSNRIKKTH